MPAGHLCLSLRSADYAKQTRTWADQGIGGTASQAGPWCETNPVFRRSGCPHHSAVPLFRHSNPKLIVQNKANSRRATLKPSALWRESYDKPDVQRVSTKQSQFLPGRGAGPGRRPCRQWGLACETNPISRGRGIPTIPVFHHSIPCRPCETKPIPAPPPYAGRIPWGPNGVVLGMSIETRYTLYPAPIGMGGMDMHSEKMADILAEEK